MINVDIFLKNLYEAISFGAGCTINSDKFKTFFLTNAVLIEYDGQRYTSKSVGEHIQEFEDAAQNYPQLFVKGFNERQISREIIQSENGFLVSSKYEKTYFRNGEEVLEHGVNNMVLVQTDSGLKIASVVW